MNRPAKSLALWQFGLPSMIQTAGHVLLTVALRRVRRTFRLCEVQLTWESEDGFVNNSDTPTLSSATNARRFRVEIKVSEAQKELIIRAAAVSKQGLSEFVRISAEQAARKVLEEVDHQL
jgi:hypothetical protein